MKSNQMIAAGLALMAMAGAVLTGPAAMAQSKRQNDKNNMRNIGIAAGAGAVYEAIHGKGTNALLLGAGAAYAGKKYEDDRKAQAKHNSYRHDYNHHYPPHK